MASHPALPFVIVFVAMFALDFVWALYTQAVTASAALRASMWATAITVLSGLGQIGYTHDPWLLIPAALGAFAGTFIALTYRHFRA